MTNLPVTLPTYQIDADARLGPAMAALVPRQQQFVIALVQTGCSQAKAAELAGYAGGPDTWKAMGWRLAHDSRVQAAMHEEAQKLIRSTSVMAVKVITAIAEDGKIDPKTRLKAATELLNRSGLHAMSEQKVTVERQESDQEKVARAVRLARELGLDPRKLLGHAGVVTDAEFQIVSPAMTSGGLEDLLE
jgi:phage terminase small subunit